MELIAEILQEERLGRLISLTSGISASQSMSLGVTLKSDGVCVRKGKRATLKRGEAW